jgi:hypothetical protein
LLPLDTKLIPNSVKTKIVCAPYNVDPIRAY